MPVRARGQFVSGRRLEIPAGARGYSVVVSLVVEKLDQAQAGQSAPGLSLIAFMRHGSSSLA